MERLFYRKSTAILIVALAMVLIFLLCMLLTMLTQFSSIRAQRESLVAMVQQAQTDEAARQQLLDYKNSDDYIREWAILKGYLPEDVVHYVESLGN